MKAVDERFSSLERATGMWPYLFVATMVACSGPDREDRSSSGVASWYVPRITAVNPTGRVITCKAGETVSLGVDVEPYQSLPDTQDWKRLPEPILSASTTGQDWCRVVVYMPWVLRADGIYKMWYAGMSESARLVIDCDLGYATSEDGINWTEFRGNPIVSCDAIPWGRGFQNPCVIYDTREKIYKMWFTSLSAWERPPGTYRYTNAVQQVGYAESLDGISWTFHLEPVADGRRPFVMEMDDGTYRMWINAQSKTDPEVGMGRNVVAARSNDGLVWQVDQDVMRPAGVFNSVIYPFVMRDRDRFAMWIGGHREGGWFDITFGRSMDGYAWTYRTDAPIFPGRTDKAAFDGRYTSTPQVLNLPGKYVMYYSARDMDDHWIAPDGSTQVDEAGVYRHIGYAELPVSQGEDPTLRFVWTVDGKPQGKTGKSIRFTGDGTGRHSVTCRVQNANGSDTYTWDIQVEG